jgi:hypothetical protein
MDEKLEKVQNTREASWGYLETTIVDKNQNPKW